MVEVGFDDYRGPLSLWKARRKLLHQDGRDDPVLTANIVPLRNVLQGRDLVRGIVRSRQR